MWTPTRASLRNLALACAGVTMVWGLGMPRIGAAADQYALAGFQQAASREQVIDFLAAIVPHHPSIPRHGLVGKISLRFVQRWDRDGMIVTFQPGKGEFSRQTQDAIVMAIARAATLAALDTAGWSVRLAVREPQAVVQGDSLSAMVALSTVALAKGDTVQVNRVVTGTVTPTGRLGVVAAVPHKVEAAHRHRLRRVIIPDTQDSGDPGWSTPFLMQVSPIGTVQKAYEALTGAPLREDARAPAKQGSG